MKQLLAFLVLATVGILPLSAQVFVITATGTVTYASNISGLAVGDTVTQTITLDINSPIVASYTGATNETRYQDLNATATGSLTFGANSLSENGNSVAEVFYGPTLFGIDISATGDGFTTDIELLGSNPIFATGNLSQILGLSGTSTGSSTFNSQSEILVNGPSTFSPLHIVGAVAAPITSISIQEVSAPEPSTVALLVAGLGALGWQARRLRRGAA